ncbi:MAG TPA: hypothetical protein VGP90_03040 [Acidimicrobiia bacterium]|jgi:hypothetical protein|nr:hypothetical protein [Acidimicrobiia bacterium]
MLENTTPGARHDRAQRRASAEPADRLGRAGDRPVVDGRAGCAPADGPGTAVGGASVASFLAILAAFGLHGGSQPASNATTTGGDSPAGVVLPDLGQGSSSGSSSGSTTNPFSRRSGGGFSAAPGSGSSSPNTRSHGS